MPLAFAEHVPLAPLCTLELGGPARFFVEVRAEDEIAEALAFAEARGVPAAVLGGGSNVVIADAGWPGLVVRMALRGLRFGAGSDDGVLTAAAGEPWDDVVAAATARGWAGLECLSGIPGSTGATPVQNVGAYGQEVAETVAAVRALDRTTGAFRTLDAEACGFGYRHSAFKLAPERHVITEVAFRLQPGGAATMRYSELKAARPEAAPSLAAVRATVLELRRKKSMLLEADDANRRSVGSFFTNPVVSDAEADAVVARAIAHGVCDAPSDVPRFPAGPGSSKLAAAWLIERAGVNKGMRFGAVGVSSRHSLALVHHGGGTTRELLALARHVRDAVHARFGVTLGPEPVLLGTTLDG